MNLLGRSIFLIIFAVTWTTYANIDCGGKAFHCVNSTHFMICVDLGSGVSSTIDDFIIQCPPTTACRSTNHFECELSSPNAQEPTPDTSIQTTERLQSTSASYLDNFPTAIDNGAITDYFVPSTDISVIEVLNNTKGPHEFEKQQATAPKTKTILNNATEFIQVTTVHAEEGTENYVLTTVSSNLAINTNSTMPSTDIPVSTTLYLMEVNETSPTNTVDIYQTTSNDTLSLTDVQDNNFIAMLHSNDSQTTSRTQLKATVENSTKAIEDMEPITEKPTLTTSTKITTLSTDAPINTTAPSLIEYQEVTMASTTIATELRNDMPMGSTDVKNSTIVLGINETNILPITTFTETTTTLDSGANEVISTIELTTTEDLRATSVFESTTYIPTLSIIAQGIEAPIITKPIYSIDIQEISTTFATNDTLYSNKKNITQTPSSKDIGTTFYDKEITTSRTDISTTPDPKEAEVSQLTTSYNTLETTTAEDRKSTSMVKTTSVMTTTKTIAPVTEASEYLSLSNSIDPQEITMTSATYVMADSSKKVIYETAAPENNILLTTVHDTNNFPNNTQQNITTPTSEDNIITSTLIPGDNKVIRSSTELPFLSNTVANTIGTLDVNTNTPNLDIQQIFGTFQTNEMTEKNSANVIDKAIVSTGSQDDTFLTTMTGPPLTLRTDTAYELTATQITTELPILNITAANSLVVSNDEPGHISSSNLISDQDNFVSSVIDITTETSKGEITKIHSLPDITNKTLFSKDQPQTKLFIEDMKIYNSKATQPIDFATNIPSVNLTENELIFGIGPPASNSATNTKDVPTKSFNFKTNETTVIFQSAITDVLDLSHIQDQTSVTTAFDKKYPKITPGTEDSSSTIVIMSTTDLPTLSTIALGTDTLVIAGASKPMNVQLTSATNTTTDISKNKIKKTPAVENTLLIIDDATNIQSTSIKDVTEEQSPIVYIQLITELPFLSNTVANTIGTLAVNTNTPNLDIQQILGTFQTNEITERNSANVIDKAIVSTGSQDDTFLTTMTGPPLTLRTDTAYELTATQITTELPILNITAANNLVVSNDEPGHISSSNLISDQDNFVSSVIDITTETSKGEITKIHSLPDITNKTLFSKDQPQTKLFIEDMKIYNFKATQPIDFATNIPSVNLTENELIFGIGPPASNSATNTKDVPTKSFNFKTNETTVIFQSAITDVLDLSHIQDHTSVTTAFDKKYPEITSGTEYSSSTIVIMSTTDLPTLSTIALGTDTLVISGASKPMNVQLTSATNTTTDISKNKIKKTPAVENTLLIIDDATNIQITSIKDVTEEQSPIEYIQLTTDLPFLSNVAVNKSSQGLNSSVFNKMDETPNDVITKISSTTTVQNNNLDTAYSQTTARAEFTVTYLTTDQFPIENNTVDKSQKGITLPNIINHENILDNALNNNVLISHNFVAREVNAAELQHATLEHPQTIVSENFYRKSQPLTETLQSQTEKVESLPSSAILSGVSFTTTTPLFTEENEDLVPKYPGTSNKESQPVIKILQIQIEKVESLPSGAILSEDNFTTTTTAVFTKDNEKPIDKNTDSAKYLQNVTSRIKANQTRDIINNNHVTNFIDKVTTEINNITVRVNMNTGDMKIDTMESEKTSHNPKASASIAEKNDSTLVLPIIENINNSSFDMHVDILNKERTITFTDSSTQVTKIFNKQQQVFDQNINMNDKGVTTPLSFVATINNDDSTNLMNKKMRSNDVVHIPDDVVVNKNYTELTFASAPKIKSISTKETATETVTDITKTQHKNEMKTDFMNKTMAKSLMYTQNDDQFVRGTSIDESYKTSSSGSQNVTSLVDIPLVSSNEDMHNITISQVQFNTNSISNIPTAKNNEPKISEGNTSESFIYILSNITTPVQKISVLEPPKNVLKSVYVQNVPSNTTADPNKNNKLNFNESKHVTAFGKLENVSDKSQGEYVNQWSLRKTADNLKNTDSKNLSLDESGMPIRVITSYNNWTGNFIQHIGQNSVRTTDIPSDNEHKVTTDDKLSRNNSTYIHNQQSDLPNENTNASKITDHQYLSKTNKQKYTDSPKVMSDRVRFIYKNDINIVNENTSTPFDVIKKLSLNNTLSFKENQTSSYFLNLNISSINNTNPLGHFCQNKNRGRYSNSQDCNTFYICISKNNTIVGRCPKDTVFSDLKKQCTKNASQCVRNNELKCNSADRFIDNLNKNSYYICVSSGNGFVRFQFQCQKGYFLNKTSIGCVSRKLEASNQSSVSFESKSEKSAHDDRDDKQKSDKKDKNKSAEEFECTEEGKFAIPGQCRKYYVCKKNKKSEYRRRKKKCDSDEVFHKEKKKCVSAESYEC